jgi:hypothetical protein
MPRSDAVQVSWSGFLKLLKLTIATNPVNRPFPSIFMIGDTGIGKNTVMSNLAKSLNVPLRTVNLGGAEPSDIQGIPFTDKDGFHRWTLPYWFEGADNTNTAEVQKDITDLFKDVPVDRLPTRFIYLDEFNRTPQDTFAPMMTFALEHKLHDAKMEGRPMIIASGNIAGHANQSFTVNEFDDAQEARFRWVHVKPELNEWVDYARKQKCHSAVVSFVRDQKQQVRTWNKEGRGTDLRTILELGCRLHEVPDSELASTTISNMIKMYLPKEMSEALYKAIKTGASAINLREMADDYSKFKPKIQKLVAEQQMDVITHLSKNILDLISEWEEDVQKKAKPGEDLFPLAETLYAEKARQICMMADDVPKEIFVNLLRNLSTEKSASYVGSVFISCISEHANVADAVLSAFTESAKSA